MTMKNVSDLAENEYVDVTRRTCHGTDKFITIKIWTRAKPAKKAKDVESDFTQLFSTAEEMQAEEDDRKKTGSPFASYMDIERENVKYWRVSKTATNHGWGPFLYDIAMELVTEMGGWFRSDKAVTGEAVKVWEFYFNNRSDVSKELCSGRKRLKHIAIQHAYQKSPASTFNQLKALGKWEQLTLETCDE